MREIKIRYAHKRNDDVVLTVYTLGQIEENEQSEIYALVQKGYDLIDNQIFTGLKDINGVEIYEGDIVEYKDYSRGAYLTARQPTTRDSVKWDKDTGGYRVRSMGTTFKASKYEVIGNIYENPELIKE